MPRIIYIITGFSYYVIISLSLIAALFTAADLNKIDMAPFCRFVVLMTVIYSAPFLGWKIYVNSKISEEREHLVRFNDMSLRKKSRD